ncbi:hypothetical protein EDD11_008372 [Mortierella claussenii]|nr:hypothetical protein EDD11_008372 [Mortierella claussenii]
MPPKRSETTASTGAKSKRASVKTAATSRKRRGVSIGSSKRRRIGTDDRSDRDEDDDEEDQDSEKEIETVKDYEDAVRRRMLNSTTHRYDDSMEQDHLAYIATLMMPQSELSPSMPVNDTTQEEWLSSPTKAVYSLGTFCLHAIVKDFKRLASDSAAAAPTSATAQAQHQVDRHHQRHHRRQLTGAHFREQVQRLPFYLSTKLFKSLKHASPELLSTKIWTALFFPTLENMGLRGSSGSGGSAGQSKSYITDLDLEGLIASQVTDTVLRAHILHNLELGPQLERINLNGMDGLSDKALAQLVRACPVLTRLSVKGCTKAGDLMLSNLSVGSLEELNISFVAAPTAKGIKNLLRQCRELRVLKMAGVVNVRDALFLDLEKDLSSQDAGENGDDQGIGSSPRPLHALENLKISSTKLGDRGFKVLMSLCGRSLRRLDISATDVTRLAPITQFCIWQEEEEEDMMDSVSDLTAAAASSSSSSSPLPSAFSSITRTQLEKLNVTRLKIYSPNEILTLFKKLPSHSLHTLLMGYLSCGQVPIRDDLLHQLCPYLEPSPSCVAEETGENVATPVAAITEYHSDPFAPEPIVQIQEFHLHTLSLFGNNNVGSSRRQHYGLHLLLQRLSPFLRRLELGYTQCKAMVLEGLLMPQESIDTGMPVLREHLVNNVVLQELGLDETLMDDESAEVLSRFRRLNRLSLANTRMGQDAVERVIEACPLLTSLDLKSCRGIPLLHRRTLLKEVRDRQRQGERANYA